MKRCSFGLALSAALFVSSIANADMPSRVALLHDAEADAAEGRLVAAMRTAAKVAEEMPSATAPQEERAAFARGLDLLTHLRAQVAHLTIAVAGAPPPEIAIEVDGVLVTTGANDVLVDPGEHVIVAKALGHDTAVATVRMRPGESKGVPLTLGVQHPPFTNPSEPKKESDDVIRPIAYASLATGIGALVVGVGSGILARDRAKDVEELCVAGRCAPSTRDEIETANTYASVSTGAFIVSGIALATSGILFLVAPKSTPPVTAAANGLGGRF